MSHNTTAASEPLIGIREEEGIQVYSPADPEDSYLVTGTYERPACTCPDFDEGCGDPGFRCRHIVAVKHQLPREETPVRKSGSARSRNGRKEAANGKTGHKDVSDPAPQPVPSVQPNSEMLLKRSVSPDGRIDALSVELSCPISGLSAAEIMEKARRGLSLQRDITALFLETEESRSEKRGTHGSWDGNGSARSRISETTDGSDDSEDTDESEAVPAKLQQVGEMNTRYGMRMFIGVQIGSDNLKLFGSRKQLGEHLVTAGYADWQSRLRPGLKLNLPCRAVTVENGEYINVERLLPPINGRNSGNGRRR